MRVPITLLSILLLLAVTALACDDGPHDDNDGGSDTDSDSDFEWCDEASGLCWQLETVSLTWDEAMDHCDDLSLGGHDDWYLPDIDELRSLLRGCPVTETGGECPIVNGSDSGDYDPVCMECLPLGNGQHSYGCYWDEGMGDLCKSPEGINWSSSEDDYYSSSDRAWRVGFDDANINSSLKEIEHNARCIRAMD